MGSIPVGGAIYKKASLLRCLFVDRMLKNELNPSKRSFETFALSVTIAQRIFGRKSGFRFPLGDYIRFCDAFYKSFTKNFMR